MRRDGALRRQARSLVGPLNRLAAVSVCLLWLLLVAGCVGFGLDARAKEAQAMDLEARGRKYESERMADEAIKTYQAVLALLQPDSAFPTTTYRLLERMGHLYSVAGRLDLAIDTAERQLELVTRLHVVQIRAGQTWRPLSAMVNLSFYHYLKGDRREALRYAQLAYDRRFQDVPLPSTLARILQLRGNAQLELLQPDVAERDFLEALRIEGGLGNSGHLANLHNSVGLVRLQKGDYQLAISEFDQAVGLARGLGTSDRDDPLALYLTNLGSTYAVVNLVDHAHQYLDEAIDLARQRKNLRLLEFALGHKSRAHRRAGQFSAALSIAQEALEIARARQAKGQEAWRLIEIGYLYLRRGEYGPARGSFESALQIAERIDHSWIRASASLGIGRVCLKEGAYAVAETYLSGPIPELQAVGVVWDFWYTRGQLLEAQGKLEGAYEAYAEAVRQIELLRVRLSNLETRVSFIEDKQETYEAVIRTLFGLGRVSEAFNYSERSKGRAFLDLLDQRRLKLRRTEAAVPEHLLEEEARLAKEISLRQAELAQSLETVEGEGAQSRQELAERRQELDGVEARWRAVAGDVRSKVRTYEGSPTWTPATVAEIQGKLRAGTGLVSYYIGRENAWLFYIDKQQAVGHAIETSPEAIKRQVLSFRQAIGSVVGERARAAADWTVLGRELYNVLLKEAWPSFKGSTYLVIVPHGILHYLPFQALLDDSGRALIEQTAISIVPSASVLKLLAATPSGSNKSLAVGNPTVPGLRPLIGAEEETLEFSRVWPGEVLLRRAATRPSVVARMNTSRIVHFATHAELNRFAPLQSSLRLTPTETDDGRLTVDVIFDQNLTAELVVLAGCDTGLGIGYKGEPDPFRTAQEQRFPPGDELVGLSRAFLYAGTPSLVASLWPVEDMSTATLMTRFYRNLKTMPKAEALRQAQLSLMHQGKGTAEPNRDLDANLPAAGAGGAKGDLSHPYFWASFMLIGDGQSVVHP